MKKIVVINGPNINLTGLREKEFYGTEQYSDICAGLVAFCRSLDAECEIYQSNIEGELVDIIQKTAPRCDGIIINSGAYTHYSIAIRDALAAFDTPFIEVHMSNVFGREDFRRQSITAELAAGVISGFGVKSYYLAATALCKADIN